MVGLPADECTIVLHMAEDAYGGDAQFVVSVDGKPVGGIRTVTASHAAGQTQAFSLPGFRLGPHTVTVTFVNDAWGGSSTKDRNLYVDSISIGDATVEERHEQASNGSVDYIVSPPPLVAIASQDVTTDSGALTLTGTLSAAPGTTVIVADAHAVLGMATVQGDGAWRYRTVLPAGAYAIRVRARDPNGFEGSAAAPPSVVVHRAVAPNLARPFRPDSPWNTELGSGTRYAAEADVRTATLRSSATPWIGADIVALYQATGDDPLATWTYDSSNGFGAPGPGVVRLRTPPTVQFRGGSDQLAVVVSPDRQSYYEVWRGQPGATRESYKVAYMVKNSVDGTGFSTARNPAQGIRAAGSSLLAGLVRTQELDDLEIPHAIAMVIASDQAAAATSADKQYVDPATAADWNSVTAYKGTIPLGTHFAIPQDVDLARIGIRTPEGLALARAYQRYGGFAVDTAPRTDLIASIEAGAATRQIDALMQDVGTIRSHLRVVVSP